MELTAKLPTNFMDITRTILKYAWLVFKHYLLFMWWLFRVEIWLFYYLLIGRWLFGLRLYFPKYYDVWFKDKKKSRGSSSSGYSFSAPRLPENTLHNKTAKSGNKTSASNIYRVQNGSVYTLNQYGGQVKAPFYPKQGGNAIFVDHNPQSDKLLVTTEKGIIAQYNTNGGQISSFSVTDAVMARWEGNDIVVQLKNGSCILYNRHGGKIRHL